MTTAQTKLLTLLGWPLGHTLSPTLHTAALHAMGIDAVYLASKVAPDDLGRAIDGLRVFSAAGANVTLPHKQAVIPLLDGLSDAAAAIGAVNTIYREGDKLIGANTDAEGLVRSLEQAGLTLKGNRVLLIGAGGAARAAIAGLLGAGCPQITVAARRIEAAETLCADLAKHFPESQLIPLELDKASELRKSAANADLLVQATSATLESRAPAEIDAFAKSLPIDALPEHAAVVDLVYAPLTTAILKTAAARGLKTIDGLGMLVWQASLALGYWFDREGPAELMREAAMDALRGS